MADDTIGAGHNSIGPDATQLIRSYVDRIERVEEEISTLNDDRKDIYAEAKGTGLDTKVLRALVRRRKMDKAERDEFDSMLELYEGVFG